jgi:cell division protease FtsH
MVEKDKKKSSWQTKKDEINKKMKNTKKPKINFYWIYGILIVIILVIQFSNWKGSGDNNKEITREKFKGILTNHAVDKILVINKEYAEIFIKKDERHSYKEIKDEKFYFVYKFVTIDGFEKDLEDYPGTNVIPETRKDWNSIIFSWLIPIAFLVIIWMVFMRKMGAGAGGGGQIFNIGKSKAQMFDKDTSVNTNFKDVAGLEEAKVEVMEIVDFLKNPKKYTKLGGKIPKGALLIGPPGTGKTLLAKAVAGEANVPFFSLSGSDFVEMFVGVGASRVRDMFRRAKEKAPCIVFIDEIDAVGRSRGKNFMTGANDERENTLNQLLSEMDGFANNAGVIILAATNRADVLDSALLRAGRFDRQIHVELPDLVERKAIFKVHIKPLKVDKSVDFEFLSKQTPGFSGADIANVCNESALIAARKGRKKIGKQDFMDAADRIIGGLEKRHKIISPQEKKVIAFHEAGHASVSWVLEYAHPLVKVSIIPRGKSLGAAWYLPEERQITTYEQIFDEITAALGGRASEDIFFGKVSTGALNDLEKVTKYAYATIVYYGLNKKIGNVSFYDSTGQQEYSFTKPYSEKTGQIIDEEVSKIVEKAYQRAKSLLIKHKPLVEKVSNLLLEKEVIFYDDLKKIFGKRPFDKEKSEDNIQDKKNKLKPKTKNNSSETHKKTKLKK